MEAADKVVLLRYEWVSDANVANERFSQIRSVFSEYNDCIEVVIASPNAKEEVLGAGDKLIKIVDGPTWGGDDESWNRVFSIVGAVQS